MGATSAGFFFSPPPANAGHVFDVTRTVYAIVFYCFFPKVAFTRRSLHRTIYKCLPFTVVKMVDHQKQMTGSDLGGLYFFKCVNFLGVCMEVPAPYRPYLDRSSNTYHRKFRFNVMLELGTLHTCLYIGELRSRKLVVPFNGSRKCLMNARGARRRRAVQVGAQLCQYRTQICAHN